MQALSGIMQSLVVTIFLGTLPLIGTIFFGLLQNDRRLSRIEGKLDLVKVSVHSLDKRLAVVETKLDLVAR